MRSVNNIFLIMKLKSILKIVIPVVVVLVLFFTSVRIVSANERGIKYTFGKANQEVLEPGLHFCIPFVTSIKTWSIAPRKLALDISKDDGGAISRDNQIIGVRLIIYWSYVPEKLYIAATKWDRSAIENMLASLSNSTIKTVIGKYTIFDLAPNQDKIGEEIKSKMDSQMRDYPIALEQLNISNFDWSAEFDRQIAETMNRAQQVKQSEQEANVAEQQNKKKIIEAQAKANALVAEAEGQKKAAQLKADALRIEAQGIADANKLKSQASSLEYQRLQWKYEIDLERAKHLAPGVETPLYIPLTAAGGIVNLK